MFKKIGKFFKAIWKAIKDLFKKESENSEAEEENVQAEIVKPKNENSFGAWLKKIGKKMGENIKNAVEWAVDHPGKAMAAITASSVGLGAVLTTVERMKRLFVDPAKRHIAEDQEKYKIYDHRVGRKWITNRPMSEVDKQWITRHCQEYDIGMGEYLQQMGWLAA